MIHVLTSYSPESNYFEVEILDKGASHLTLSIGVVSQMFSMDNLPGRVNDSYAFCPGDGLLFRSRDVGSPFGPRAEPGDKIGCGKIITVFRYSDIQTVFMHVISSDRY